MPEILLPRHYLLGAIMFMLIITGGIYMLHDARVNVLGDDGYEMDSGDFMNNYTSTFDKFDALNESMTGLQRSISQPNPGLFGWLDALAGSAYYTMATLFTNFSIIFGVFGSFSTFFHVPVWVGATMIMMVIVVVVFAIFGAIFRTPL